MTFVTNLPSQFLQCKQQPGTNSSHSTQSGCSSGNSAETRASHAAAGDAIQSTSTSLCGNRGNSRGNTSGVGDARVCDFEDVVGSAVEVCLGERDLVVGEIVDDVGGAEECVAENGSGAVSWCNAY